MGTHMRGLQHLFLSPHYQYLGMLGYGYQVLFRS